MIVLVANRPEVPRPAVSYALEWEGFQTRDVYTTEQADSLLRVYGATHALLVMPAELLLEDHGREEWAGLVDRWPGLNFLATALAHLEDSARERIRVQNGILLEEPFGSAAVVAAVHRAAQTADPSELCLSRAGA